MPRPGSSLDLGDGDDVSHISNIVKAEESPPLPNGSLPPASLEQMRVGQSNTAARQTDVLSLDGDSVTPSSHYSPEISATVHDLESDTEAGISIQDGHKANHSFQPSPGLYVGSTNSISGTEIISEDLPADPKEQEASHNRTKIALLDVHKRKQEVEQQLRRVQMEYGQTLQDHAAGQETLGQKFQGLVAHGEEQEAAHNKTRIALVRAHKEKHDAEQKLSRAVAEYRQKLQAVGIMAEDNAQPIWEVDSDGRQTRPLYKDFPNMFRESQVNLLVNRANCRFMLGDYQGMATIAFGALEVTERLNFQPLSARCQFIIGISFYHSGRFREAHHRFWLALECKDGYGISTEYVKRWLGKCEDSMAGKVFADAKSPIRDTDRTVELKFRADSFFARATNVALDLGSPDAESDENVEDVEGYTSCPSEGYADESDEIAEVSNPTADGPGEVLPERDQVIPSISPTQPSAPQSQESRQAETTMEEPDRVSLPTSRYSDTTSVAFSELSPNATENSVAQPASRPRSSTSVDPKPVEPLHGSFDISEKNVVKVRGRAVTNAEQKRAKYSKPGRLPGPLSWLTKDMDDIPIQDMKAWVNRSLEERLQEATKGQPQNRFPVAFILYRSAYAKRIRNRYKVNDPQIISSLASESWEMELPNVREQYAEWAMLERQNQEKAVQKIT